MPSYLPFEIQVDILRRLPVKSLLQFQSVCKSWKSLIQTSDFIADYRGQVQHLLVRYGDSVTCTKKFVSIVDDDTFPHQKVDVTIPRSVKLTQVCRTIGSSHGLFCLYGEGRDETGFKTGIAVVWNPSIRKAISVYVQPYVPNAMYGTVFVLGFGVCRKTSDPKIVKINHIYGLKYIKTISCNHIYRQVEVFTLSTRSWRNPYTNFNLPRKSIQFIWMQEAVDEIIYWLATDSVDMESHNLIISFDMTSEEFKEVNLPHNLAHKNVYMLSMSRLRESLVVGETIFVANNYTFDLWMMENGVQKLFSKLFSVTIPSTSILFARGFRKTGEPFIEILGSYCGSLTTYDPYLKSINDVRVIGSCFLCQVSSYMETLLLL